MRFLGIIDHILPLQDNMESTLNQLCQHKCIFILFLANVVFISSGCSLFLTFALSTNVYWDWSTISVLNCTFDLHISPEHPMKTIYAVYSWCFYACLLGWPFYLVWVQRTQVTSLIKKEINMLLKIGWVSNTNSFINFFLTLHVKLIVSSELVMIRIFYV